MPFSCRRTWHEGVKIRNRFLLSIGNIITETPCAYYVQLQEQHSHRRGVSDVLHRRWHNVFHKQKGEIYREHVTFHLNTQKINKRYRIYLSRRPGSSCYLVY